MNLKSFFDCVVLVSGNKAAGSDGKLEEDRAELENRSGADFLTEADTAAQACTMLKYLQT